MTVVKPISHWHKAAVSGNDVFLLMRSQNLVSCLNRVVTRGSTDRVLTRGKERFKEVELQEVKIRSGVAMWCVVQSVRTALRAAPCAFTNNGLAPALSSRLPQLASVGFISSRGIRQGESL